MAEFIKNENLVTVVTDETLSAKNASELKIELRKIFDEGIERIVFDMKNTEVIDSIGLGLLAATHNSLKTRNSKLELINVRDNVLKVITLMRLDKYFIVSSLTASG